jgi:hypothetical protein
LSRDHRDGGRGGAAQGSLRPFVSRESLKDGRICASIQAFVRLCCVLPGPYCTVLVFLRGMGGTHVAAQLVARGQSK